MECRFFSDYSSINTSYILRNSNHGNLFVAFYNSGYKGKIVIIACVIELHINLHPAKISTCFTNTFIFWNNRFREFNDILFKAAVFEVNGGTCKITHDMINGYIKLTNIK